MGKKSSDPPDVAGAAAAEGEFARETARDVTYADRPNQNNPFGSVRWQTEQAIDPATGEPVTQWTQNQTLDPSLQGGFESLTQGAGTQADLYAQALGRAQGEMSGAPEWEQFGSAQGLEYDPTQLRQRAEDTAYEQSTSRLDPQFQQREQALDIKLRNQGLNPGDQAYDSAMGSFGRERTDAYNQAQLSSVGTGRDEAQQLYEQQLGSTEFSNALRSQDISEYLAQRGFSLGEAQGIDAAGAYGGISDVFAGGG